MQIDLGLGEVVAYAQSLWPGPFSCPHDREEAGGPQVTHKSSERLRDLSKQQPKTLIRVGCISRGGVLWDKNCNFNFKKQVRKVPNEHTYEVISGPEVSID